MAKKGVIDWIALILVIIGALNWGFIGIGLGNVAETIFGTGALTTIVYILVGLGALWTIYLVAKK